MNHMSIKIISSAAHILDIRQIIAIFVNDNLSQIVQFDCQILTIFAVIDVKGAIVSSVI